MLVDSGEYIISSIFGKGRGPSFWLTLLSGDKKTSEFDTPRPCTTALRHADAKAESGSPDAMKNTEDPS